MLRIGLIVAVFSGRLVLELARPWLNDNFLLSDTTRRRGGGLWRALWWVAMTGSLIALAVVLTEQGEPAPADGTKAPGTVPAPGGAWGHE